VRNNAPPNSIAAAALKRMKKNPKRPSDLLAGTSIYHGQHCEHVNQFTFFEDLKRMAPEPTTRRAAVLVGDVDGLLSS
jgi:hypothetical protein